MSHFSFSSLRFRLILLVLLAVIPALGLTFYTGLEQRRHAADHVQSDAMQLAARVSAEHERLIEGTRQFLYMLAQLPQVLECDKTTCSRLFSELLKQYPHYLNIGAIGSDGNLLSSAIPFGRPLNLTDRPYFQQALKTRKFAIGEYQIGRVVGKPVINFGYPVIGETRNVTAVVFVALDLKWVNQLAAQVQLPHSSTLTLIDHKGTILARYPETEKWVGKTMSELSIVKTILAQGKGVAETMGFDGIRRLYSFTSVSSAAQTSGKIYIAVGIPNSEAFAQVDRILIRNLILLGLVALLALAAAWIVGDLLVLKRLNPIVKATKRLTAGDLGARTGVTYDKGELSQLACAFDDMARSLENRETDRKRAEDALRQSERKFRDLYDNAPVGYQEYDKEGHITNVNRTELEMLNYTLEEIIGQPVWKFAVEEETSRQAALAKLAGTMPPGRDFERAFRRKDGTTVPVLIEDRILRDEEGHIAGIRSTIQDITESKRADEALRESEQRYRNLVENAPDVIYTLAPDGTITSLNPAFETITGWSSAEWVGKQFASILHPEDLPLALGFLQRIVQGETLSTFELKVLTKSDDYVVGEFIATPQTEKGSVVSVLGIARVITERKRIEEAFKESEKKYRQVVENAVDIIYTTDAEGNFTYVNTAGLKIAGYSLEEFQQLNYLDLVVPEHRDRLSKIYITQFKERKPTIYTEFPFYNKSGEVIWFGQNSSLVIEGEKVSGFHIIARDITERKRAEIKLQKSKEFAETVLNSVDDDISIINVRDFRITGANQTFLTRLGLKEEEVLGKFCYEVTHHRDRPCTLPNDPCPLQEALKTSRHIVSEHVHYCKNGEEVFVEVSASPIRDEKGEIFQVVHVARDITARKRAEKEMSELQGQLRQSQKMEAIGQLAGGIAHDFNNLLTIIKGYSQLSLIELKESDPLRSNIKEIQNASERAVDLTRQILAFSRRQVLDIKVLDLNSILRDLDKMLRRVIGEDIELVTLLTDPLGRVKTDPGQIEQVIMNIAVNARDAMPSGGKLTIETGNVELDEAYARRHIAVIPGRYVMLSMIDTGTGMTPEVRDRVFDPFFTTKEKGKGTGLGLSTVYGIVKQSEGNIWVYSEPGRGTTFKIYLPSVDEPLEELRQKAAGKEFPRGSETILIVEDDEAVRKLSGQILKRQGYTILEANNGNEALRLCEERKEPIQLILTDVVMPEMSGRELVERFKKLSLKFRVLYMSGYTDNAIVRHGVLEKGVNYIQKPFTPDGLARMVREVLDG